MDNGKTGALIRQLRKEKGMTQKQLAQRLHITDRAVSKWENGLCAPDIALLEPLSQILEVSVLELIAGEQVPRTEQTARSEESARSVLEYSKREVTHKVRAVKKTYLGAFGLFLCLAVAVGLLGAWMRIWRNGIVIDRSVSPDQSVSITVYRKIFSDDSVSQENGILLVADLGGGATSRVFYGNCDYQGIWWAPDSGKYVVSLKYDEETVLTLDWLDRHVISNLSAYLSTGVRQSELGKYGFVDKDDGWPAIQYQVLQWGLDSQSILIYYSFEDEGGALHEGYFWYHCEDGTVRAVLELQRPQSAADAQNGY